MLLQKAIIIKNEAIYGLYRHVIEDILILSKSNTEMYKQKEEKNEKEDCQFVINSCYGSEPARRLRQQQQTC